MPAVNPKAPPQLAGSNNESNFRSLILHSRRYLPDVLAIAAACVFVLVAAYKIDLPGLYMDEVDFVNAAQGAHDNTMIHLRLGPVPVLIMPYLGALKAWLYAPIFGLFGVSALTIRLPVILLAAVTLLIWFQLIRSQVGAVWAVIAAWLMAIDPSNLFPSKLDWGPTVLMHFFEAAIIALWFSYRDKLKLWEILLTFVCAGLGFFDKFSFIWVILAFLVAICFCYPDTLKKVWGSSRNVSRWAAIFVLLLGLGIASLIILRVLHLYAGGSLELGLMAKWYGLLGTLSGIGVGYFLFGSWTGLISFVPYWLIITDCYLALICVFLLGQKTEGQESLKDGLFFFLIALLIFAQIVITPQAGGPHHFLMVFPLPLLAFIFLARAVYRRVGQKKLRLVASLLLLAAALCVLVVNVHNTLWYLSRFHTNAKYNPSWSPAIYSLSRYINKHGREAQSIISTDWGLHNQLHALAPRDLRPRIHDYWPSFKQMGNQDQATQRAALNHIFPQGKSFALAFAASKETFPETRRNFLAAVASNPELKCTLIKEFWSAGEKIYEVYEIDRRPQT